MTNTLKFYGPLWGDLQGNLNTAGWPVVTQAWQDKRYRDCVHSLLDYINPSLRMTYGNPAQTSFSVPHGSVIVNIKLDNDNISIDCPMVDISSAVRLPLLRKAAEVNFSPLVLAQMRLNGNQLTFQYSSSLDTSEPYKTYYALKEICQTADRYDDEFGEKFKAKALIEPKVKRFAPVDLDKAWSIANDIITETFSFIQYFDAQRWFGSSLDYMVIALKRLDLAIHPQGFLKTEMDRVGEVLINNQLTIPERAAAGTKFLQQLQQGGKDAFIKNIYEAEVFVPAKWRTNAEQVKAAMTNALNQTKKYHDEKNYVAAVIEAHYCIYDLFYKNNMDHAVNNILLGALTGAGGKSWSDASATLLQGMQTLANTQF
jgi:hypothetical protein